MAYRRDSPPRLGAKASHIKPTTSGAIAPPIKPEATSINVDETARVFGGEREIPAAKHGPMLLASKKFIKAPPNMVSGNDGAKQYRAKKGAATGIAMIGTRRP